MSAGKFGLQKLNIPQVKASPKAAIAANLGSASRSTGVSYGIFAQRTLTGCGIHLNNRLFNSASISATRHALNDNRTALFNNIGVAPHRCNHNNGNNTMNKFMAGMMAMNMMAQLTAQTMQTINEAKAAKAENTDNSSKVKNSRNVNEAADPAIKAQDSPTPGSITAMKGAKDSSTLRDAIGIAKGEKSKMEAQLKDLEAKLPSMKETAEAATEQLEDLKPKVAEAKEARDTAEANKKDAEGNKKSAEKVLKGAQDRLQGAKDGLVAAKDSLVSAKQGLGSAQAKLAVTPKTNPDGTPNTAYTEAEQAVTKAEQAVQDAENKLQEASNEYKAANDADKKARDDFQRASEQLANNEQTLAEMTAKFEKLDGEYKKLEGQQAEAQKKVDEYNEALKNQTDWKSAIAQFEAEIPAQEQRLNELVAKEEKGYDAATITIDKLATKGDVSALKGKDKENYDNAMNLRRNVSYTKLLKTPGETIGSKTFRKGEFNGETLYMIGTKPVDQRTYNFEKSIAEEGQKIMANFKSPFSN